ncbi:hypothetical protein Trydic_g10030 [Trypoxylus dichotomus]
MAVNAELAQQGVRTTKVVNTNVGIQIQLASAANYRQLVRLVSAMKVQCHSYQLTEENPLKVVIHGVSEKITEEEVAQDLANLLKDGSWSSTPSDTARLRPADEERRGKEDLFGDLCVRHERHRRIQTGPSDSMPPLPALRTRTAELPRGRGLRQMRMTVSDGGVRQAEGRAGQVRPMLGPAHRQLPRMPQVSLQQP